MVNQTKINELIEKRVKAKLGGGEKRIESTNEPTAFLRWLRGIFANSPCAKLS